MTKVVNRSTQRSTKRSTLSNTPFVFHCLGHLQADGALHGCARKFYSSLKKATPSMSQHLQKEEAATICRSAYFEMRAILLKRLAKRLFWHDWLCRGFEMPGLGFWQSCDVMISIHVTGIRNLRETLIWDVEGRHLARTEKESEINVCGKHRQ